MRLVRQRDELKQVTKLAEASFKVGDPHKVLNPIFCRIPICSTYGFISGTYKIVGSGWLRSALQRHTFYFVGFLAPISLPFSPRSLHFFPRGR